MIRIAICDDEPKALEFISKSISLEFERLGVLFSVSEFKSGNSLLDEHRKNPFEVVFLDISMPEISGFEIAKALRMETDDVFIIFITSKEELVYDSFDFRPFNFIKKEEPKAFLKRLSRIIAKLYIHIKQSSLIILELPRSEKKAIRIKDIVYIKSDKNYLEYILTNSPIIVIRGKLTEIEETYIEYHFIRVHNRYIINMRHIKDVNFANNEIQLINDNIVEISRKYKSAFDEKYTLYLRSLR
ncbi:MAG: LytTR family DNA-binding domain-containing protein [Oscillospiraceae bacterium]|nr:LytTR family DNA-binding domain-containing protein [Oscillospiraceae bacterium]